MVQTYLSPTVLLDIELSILGTSITISNLDAASTNQKLIRYENAGTYVGKSLNLIVMRRKLLIMV